MPPHTICFLPDVYKEDNGEDNKNYPDPIIIATAYVSAHFMFHLTLHYHLMRKVKS